MGLILQFLPWIVGGLAVTAATVGAYQFVDNRWATDAGIAEGRKREKADLQPQLDAGIACQTSLAAQNEAVAKLGAESKARQERGARALQEAQKGARQATTEAQRLRAASATVGERGACPAGEAVKAIREGLGK